MNPDPLTVEIVTPTSTVDLHGISYMRAPGVDGLFGVLEGHIPAMIALDVGEISLEQQATRRYWATSGGFAEIHRKRVVLLLETAEPAGDINRSRANEALERARRRVQSADKDPEIDKERAQQALKRARNRLTVADRAQ